MSDLHHPIETFGDGRLTVTVTGEVGRKRTLLLVGEADMASADAITDALSSLLSAPGADVVLDLSGLSFIDSTGIRALLLGDAIASRQRRLVLRGAQPNVRRVFEVLHLHEVFEITD